jgi:serine/threonine-protein kinase
VKVSVSSGPPKIALPGLSFKSEADAAAVITGLGLEYGESQITYSPNVAAGFVIGVQLPPSTDLLTNAQQVVKGSTVNLVVSNGLVQVPDLTGQPVTQAQSTLTGSALQLTVRLIADDGCTGQTVASQSLVGDQPQKSTIDLTYCSGV